MTRKSTTRGLILATALALICGVLHALPYLGASAQPATLISASRAVAAEQGLSGFHAPSLGGRIAAWLWAHGGENSVATGQIAEAFFFWTIIALVVLLFAGILGWFVPRIVGKFVTVLALVLLAGSCALVLWNGFSNRAALTQPIVLTAPIELADLARQQPKGTVFSTASALPYLVLLAPGSTGKLDPATAAGFSANAVRWRDGLRQFGWQSAVLSGPTAETQPLLEHLLASPDWRLAGISNQGYFFLREKGPQPPVFDPEKIQLSTPRDTAIYLAQTAERLDALRRLGESRDTIAKALDYAPRDADVLVRAASLHAAHKRWQDAITYCDRALQADSNQLYARLLKSLALLETGRPEVAESEAATVLARQPNDSYTLFLYARICRTLHDYRREAETLEKLIDLTESNGQPVPANYYVYLGQAYVKSSDAENALKAYRAALSSPDILPDLAADIRESIATIERKKGS